MLFHWLKEHSKQPINTLTYSQWNRNAHCQILFESCWHIFFFNQTPKKLYLRFGFPTCDNFFNSRKPWALCKPKPFTFRNERARQYYLELYAQEIPTENCRKWVRKIIYLYWESLSELTQQWNRDESYYGIVMWWMYLNQGRRDFVGGRHFFVVYFESGDENNMWCYQMSLGYFYIDAVYFETCTLWRRKFLGRNSITTKMNR